MAGGSWDPNTAKVLAGLYINFVNAALAQIRGGERGIVAMPLTKFSGTATPKTFYTIEAGAEARAIELFGADNIKPIQRVFRGGASQILVYTMPTYDEATVVQDYAEMRDAYAGRPFNVFVFDGEVTPTEQDNTLTWMKQNKGEGKHFEVVFGGSLTDDQDPAIGNARTVRLADEDGYAVNLIVGAVETGVPVSSAEFAPYIAGLIASTPINKSITYAQINVDDVTIRLTNAQRRTAVQAGSLVLTHDGKKVKVERGVTTAQTENGVKKIRTARARQAMQTDITETASDNYIGKVDNNIDGQKALISAIKAYLEQLATSNVITNEITVELDPNYQSIGDSVYLAIKVVEVDSMEEIYLTIYV